MVFKRLLSRLGVGGPSVDTVVQTSAVQPGGILAGQVRLRGGTTECDVDHVTLELVARVEAEYADGESEGLVVFDRTTLPAGFRLAAEEERVLPFAFALPWETPVTELHGQPLGVGVGVRTELAVAGARDVGDLDPLAVGPLPVQEAILEAFGRLGFTFGSADLELGHIRDSSQQLPFYQEIELTPPSRYAQRANQVELTFLARPDAVEIVLEADKRGGLFSEGHDTVHRFVTNHHDVAQEVRNAEVEVWVLQLLEEPAGHAPPAAGHAYGGKHEHHASGLGVGAVAAGAAAGVVGGMVAAEVVDEIGDEIGDAFEGEEEELVEEPGGEE